MANSGFTLTFDFPTEKGLPVDALADALRGVQDVLRRTVEHLGDRQSRSGRPPNWVAFQSALKVSTVRAGSLLVDFELESSVDRQEYLDNYGPAAIEALLNWDGEEGSGLPQSATNRLYEIRGKFSDEVKLWLGDADNDRRVELKSRSVRRATTPDHAEALLHGWLREVNWHQRTAQLHDYHGEFVRLRFGADLDESMRQLATQFVEIRGHGRINAKDEWTSIQVEQLSPAGARNEPFDTESFLNDPNPRVFDPSQVVRTSEPFDVDEFIRYIHEAREDSP